MIENETVFVVWVILASLLYYNIGLLLYYNIGLLLDKYKCV